MTTIAISKNQWDSDESFIKGEILNYNDCVIKFYIGTTTNDTIVFNNETPDGEKLEVLIPRDLVEVQSLGSLLGLLLQFVSLNESIH
jgi:hypothetical protein